MIVKLYYKSHQLERVEMETAWEQKLAHYYDRLNEERK